MEFPKENIILETLNRFAIEKKKENYKLIALAILSIAIVILFLRGYETTPQVAIITTPEVKGKFEAVKPEQKSLIQNLNTEVNSTNTEPNYRTSDKEKFLQSQINELIAENKALQQMFNLAPDSTQFEMYKKAIELKSFNHTWDNDTIKAIASGLVRGEIQSIKLDYTIKAQKIEAPKQKEMFLRVLGGGGFGINKELNQLTWSASVGFQNKEGNIIRGQFQRVDNQDYYLVGYEFSVFNWKH